MVVISFCHALPPTDRKRQRIENRQSKLASADAVVANVKESVTQKPRRFRSHRHKNQDVSTKAFLATTCDYRFEVLVHTKRRRQQPPQPPPPPPVAYHRAAGAAREQRQEGDQRQLLEEGLGGLSALGEPGKL